MRYTINISRHINGSSDGRHMHWAKVVLNASGELAAREYFNDTCKRYPASDGFALILEREHTEGFTLAYSEGA